MRIEYGGTIVYQSQPRQFLFHEAVTRASHGKGPVNILYGGAAGGGKTEALLQEAFSWGMDPRWKNLRIAVFRKTFTELEKYFILRAFDCYPNDTEEPLYRYSSQKHIMRFLKTGAKVEFNYCDSDADVKRYQGAEWDILIIDELTHFTEYKITYLKTRNRTKKTGFIPLFLAGTNPGDVGHAHVKRLWIEKNDYKEGEGTADNYIFIPAKVYDNRYIIDNNPDYVQKLLALPEMERRALLEGDWNIFAGQYFREIRDELHGFDDFEIPLSWPRFIAFDYGYFPHPASVGWYAVDFQGIVWRYKELLVQRYTFEKLARKIVAMCTEEEIKAIAKEYVVGPPDVFAKRGNAEGKSGAEELQEVFDEVGWILVQADPARVNGWRLMRQFLEPRKFEEKVLVRFMISRSCRNWWKSVPQMQHDPNRPEDVRKIGVTEEGKITDGDDCGDETRYALMSRFEPPQKEERKQEIDRYGAPIRKQKASNAYKGMRDGEGKLARPEYKGFAFKR